MQAIKTAIPEVLVFEPKVFGDDRGFFLESFNARVFQDLTGLDVHFVQDNHSKSTKDVLRGMHFQTQQAQGKLVRVVQGAVFDVVVDIRKDSATFGKWIGEEISAENKRQMWVPPGFAHGFLVLSDCAEFLYKTTDFYAPQFERCLKWDDVSVGIEWPLQGQPILSGKDQAGLSLQEVQQLL